MKDIRTAILEASDTIETSGQYAFLATRIPAPADPKIGCGTYGCALGWITYHLGIQNGNYEAAIPFLNLPTVQDPQLLFYQRLDRLTNHGEWRWSNVLCAKALRLYANKYHPEEVPA